MWLRDAAGGSIRDCFEGLPESRDPRGLRHLLPAVLTLAVLAILHGKTRLVTITAGIPAEPPACPVPGPALQPQVARDGKMARGALHTQDDFAVLAREELGAALPAACCKRSPAAIRDRAPGTTRGLPPGRPGATGADLRDGERISASLDHTM